MVQSALNAAGLRRAKFAAAKAGVGLPKRKKDAVTKDFSDTCIYVHRDDIIFVDGCFILLPININSKRYSL